MKRITGRGYYCGEKTVFLRDDIEKAIRKLAKYEDLEEQGLLIRLPCKVGDTVYEPRPDRGFISVYEITLITISGTNIFYKWMLIDGIYSNLDGFSNDKIGKTVFITRKEAEKKLKEMEDKANTKMEDCSFVKECVSKGLGEPMQKNGKCAGYQTSEIDDEPCERCKNCELNEFYEEE